jgi:hypothetical protein
MVVRMARENPTWDYDRHMAVLAGVDFFSVEAMTWRSLTTYYVLFFLELETRRVNLAGITPQPTEKWMTQMARNATDENRGLAAPSLHSSRSRQKVLRRIPEDIGRGRRKVPASSSTKSKLERVCGMLGSISRGGGSGIIRGARCVKSKSEKS